MLEHEFLSEPWALAWGECIRQSPSYQSAARAWEWPLALAVQPGSASDSPERRAVFLELFQGDCREARVASSDDLAQAAFVLSADAGTWKRVIEGELEPIPAIMRGQVKLEKGSLVVLTRFLAASKELVAAARQVPTVFPTRLE